MFSPNPISKQKLTSSNHSFKFLCSISLLSMVEVLQNSVWFPKNMVFKMMVQTCYWAALILHLLGCLWKWLFGVKNALSRVSSTKYKLCWGIAGSVTHWWPNQHSLWQIQQKLSFIWIFFFFFLPSQIWRISWELAFDSEAFCTQSQM